jgi:cell division protein FtsI (penicillin-binding protein 3)
MIFAAFMTIGVRLFFIQVWHHQELSSKVEKTVNKDRPEKSCRGMILDRSGKILAMSTMSYRVFADNRLIKNPEEVRSKLNELKIKFPKELLSLKDRSYVPLAENIDFATMNQIKSWKICGLGFEPSYKRKYPEQEMGCYLLGVVSKEGKGLEGVELACDPYLTGKQIRKLKYRDGQGREIPDKLTELDDMKGADVYLTIDRNLQFIAEQEVDAAFVKTKSKSASIIIQDPNTGEILALACRPAFIPETYTNSEKSLSNPAICNIFEPGSTFKLITAAAALEENVIKRDEAIWCENGKYEVYGHTIKDHEQKGLLSFDEIIEYSSNIGTAKIGQRLGKNLLYKYIRQFGFNAKTGIDLPGEAKGLLKTPEAWSGLSLPIISFGQEIGVTALQIINAYSAIANNGLLLEPVIVKKVVSADGKIVYNSEKKIIRRAISEKVAKDLKDILFKVVENGTGQLARVSGYRIGGKTGTAQKRDPATGKYSSRLYTASFCGMVPVENPQLTILVILDDPKTDYWASTTAVPVFQKVCSRSIQYLRILPKKDAVLVANKNIANDRVR